MLRRGQFTQFLFQEKGDKRSLSLLATFFPAFLATFFLGLLVNSGLFQRNS